MAKRSTPFLEDRKRYTSYGVLEWQEPSFWAVAIYRFGQWVQLRKNMYLKKLLWPIYLALYALITVLTGINLPPTAKIGPGLRIWHFGCIVLHPAVEIGKNCDIRHEVTIGNRQEYGDVPVIGDNVNIGVGAKILGRIRIGNNVLIGANAVVIHDVPDNCLAVGNPARIIARKES
jgi:serine O-acetyltransferase